MENLVSIPVTYHRQWQDGFGARGWKLDCSIGDPMVIASTADTGDKLPTSVLVHDVFDHYLCGFPLSGHRNEAKALVQLQLRTGSDPTPDFSQMVNEDVMLGIVNGESLMDFLPDHLQDAVPDGIHSEKSIIKYLSEKYGEESLRRMLVEHFFLLGKKGKEEAARCWSKNGLDYQLRTAYGLAMQEVLILADYYVVHHEIDSCHINIKVGKTYCAMQFSNGLEIRYALSHDRDS